jgi:tetratricopeptide (TPR) repeat protein
VDAWRPGSRFGDLEVERELGRGAFGSVLLARDTLVGRRVALKILRLPGGGTAEQERAALLREAQVVGRLKSPYVATLYRVHALPDGWAFELEYVEGGSLDDRLAREGRLPAHEAARILAGVLAGLRDAHEQGIVHGDVKPGNVLLGPDGTVKLVDFGLARFMGEISLRLSRADVVGTPAYMAPEVIMGDPPGPLADLWSAGVVFYRMLSGRMPFPGHSLGSMLPAILNLPPAPLDPGIPAHLADLALRCLGKSPRQRPASCEDALHDLRPHAVAEQRPTPLPDRATALAGRAAERARLHAAADRAATSGGTAVLLTGELGIGKSSLAADLMAHATARGFRWAEARVTAVEGLLRPLLASLRDLLARPDAQGPAGIESRLFGTATNLLRALLEERGPVSIESRQQIAWGVEELLSGLADERPLGVLVEDAHLANPDDWKLLEEIDRRLPSARILLCLVAGTEPGAPPPPFAGRQRVEHVHVGPLDADAIVRLLEERGEVTRIAPEVFRRIHDASEGNPLFAIELLRHLRESGAVVSRDRVLCPGPGWGKAALPHRLRELLRARLGCLREEERALLDVAAVDGVVFDGENVAAAAGRPLLDVLRTLQGICRRTGLVVPRDRGYRFAHALLQEAIAEDLAPALRRALHARLAETIEARATTRPAASATLALHWEGAGEPGRARTHFVEAAREAIARQEHLRALDFAERAGLSPERLDAEAAARNAGVLLDLAGSYRTLGRPNEAEQVLERLDEAATASGDAELGLKVLVLRTQGRYDTRGLVDLDEDALRDAAERVAEPRAKGNAFYLLGRIAKYRGALDEAERCFLRADGIFVSSAEMGWHSSALDQLGSLALRRGRWHHAEALYRDAARISAMAGRRTNAAISEVNAAYAAFSRGAIEGLEARLMKAIRIFLLEGAETHAAHARVHVSYVRYAHGDLAGAVASVEEALPPLRKARHLRGLISATTQRAHLAAVAGALDEARSGLAEARRLAELAEDDVSRLTTEALGCHVACFLGDRAGSIAAAREAVGTARRIHEIQPRSEEAVLSLAEAVLYGLPWECVRGTDELLAGARPEEEPLVEVPRALHLAAGSFADPSGDPGRLEAAAEMLRSERVGARRAALRAVAQLLAAEAHRRRGDLGAAAREAEAGAVAATALGHVWLEARLLRLRAGLPGGGAHATRLAHIMGHLSADLPAAERKLLLDAWAGGFAT